MLILKSKSVKQALIHVFYVNKSETEVLKISVFVNLRNYSHATLKKYVIMFIEK